MYESPESCPEELLLWFHHVPYTHKLKSGKTVIQHIYDEHNNGVKNVERYIEAWKGLKGLIDDARYAHILSRFEAQRDHAIVWRDSINGYFRKRSGIDSKSSFQLDIKPTSSD